MVFETEMIMRQLKRGSAGELNPTFPDPQIASESSTNITRLPRTFGALEELHASENNITREAALQVKSKSERKANDRSIRNIDLSTRIKTKPPEPSP